MKQKFPFGLIALILCILYIIYDQTTDYRNGFKNDDLVWVYVELHLDNSVDTASNFYFGQIKQGVIDQIEANPNSKGIFKLSNIRYWNTEDLLEVYEDEDIPGYRIQKISEIRELLPYKEDPILIFDFNDLHPSAKDIRREKEKSQVKDSL